MAQITMIILYQIALSLIMDYPLNQEFITLKSPDLIITVDNGISSVEGVDFVPNIILMLSLQIIISLLLFFQMHLASLIQTNRTIIFHQRIVCQVAFYTLLALRQHLIDIGHLTSPPNMLQYLILLQSVLLLMSSH